MFTLMRTIQYSLILKYVLVFKLITHLLHYRTHYHVRYWSIEDFVKSWTKPVNIEIFRVFRRELLKASMSILDTTHGSEITIIRCAQTQKIGKPKDMKMALSK
jgi:hypothetical protein